MDGGGRLMAVVGASREADAEFERDRQKESDVSGDSNEGGDNGHVYIGGAHLAA